jgi:hypothetical protein
VFGLGILDAIKIGAGATLGALVDFHQELTRD